jgi:S-adenosylmethionine:tRNA ribosyltransferase-isomerase
MIAADRPHAEPAKLLLVDGRRRLRRAAVSDLPQLLRPGDLVVANDAATLPASLHGIHAPSGDEIEVRLAGRLSSDEDVRFVAIMFGAGDYRTRTEDRAAPPPLKAGDRLRLGPLSAVVERTLDHPRLIALRFDAPMHALWSGLARHGRAIQYAHVPEPLALWDVWTNIANAPIAFEPPSAGFALTWSMLAAFARRGIGFATLTHAAGISSTGDEELDKRLPFDEAYRIPEATVAGIRKTKAEGGRVIAIGTSIVRALEHAAQDGALRSGAGVATGRVGPETPLKLVDAILTGVHAAGESHYELLRAFVTDDMLSDVSEAIEANRFRNHEFGDFVLMERAKVASARGIADGGERVRYLRRDQQEGLRS